MATLPTITTDRLVLRNIGYQDIKDMYEYASTDLVGPTAGWSPHKTIYDTEAVITSFINSQKAGELGVWAITLKSNHKMIGTIELYNWVFRFSAELGYSVNPDYWGNGFASEAGAAVLDFAFNHLRLKRVEAGTFETNYQSMRVCEKLGFTREGVLRNSYLRYDGVVFNKVVYGITDRDYYQKNLREYK